jgi:hypothetical protein
MTGDSPALTRAEHVHDGMGEVLGPLLSRLPVVFAVGAAISLLMVVRSQVGGDQLDMLARGWLFTHGDWVQFGLTTSANGKSPGGLTSLLVGIPLMVWRDYRSPALLILLSHVLAYFLLDRIVRRILTPGERLLFGVLYWLNPWRLYHSAFVWNANWVFLFGAIHLWTVHRQRKIPSFWASLLHVLALGAFLELHSAVIILALASVFLWWRGYFRPSWPGVALGAGLSAVALIPWVQTVAANPALLPGGKGFLLRGLVYVFPLVRGVGYWLRYPSLSFGGGMTDFDFSAVLGREDGLLGPSLGTFATAIGVASALVSILAAVWFWRRNRRRWRASPVGMSDRVWLHGYVVWTFAAALASFALSPTTAMQWQGFSVVHAAVLPLVLWGGALLRTRRKVVVRRLARVHVAVAIVLLVGMAMGSPMYRRGGRESVAIALRGDRPMYHELGFLRHTAVTVGGKGMWTPDVFLANPAEGR